MTAVTRDADGFRTGSMEQLEYATATLMAAIEPDGGVIHQPAKPAYLQSDGVASKWANSVILFQDGTYVRTPPGAQPGTRSGVLKYPVYMMLVGGGAPAHATWLSAEELNAKGVCRIWPGVLSPEGAEAGVEAGRVKVLGVSMRIVPDPAKGNACSHLHLVQGDHVAGRMEARQALTSLDDSGALERAWAGHREVTQRVADGAGLPAVDAARARALAPSELGLAAAPIRKAMLETAGVRIGLAGSLGDVADFAAGLTGVEAAADALAVALAAGVPAAAGSAAPAAGTKAQAAATALGAWRCALGAVLDSVAAAHLEAVDSVVREARARNLDAGMLLRGARMRIELTKAASAAAALVPPAGVVAGGGTAVFFKFFLVFPVPRICS